MNEEFDINKASHSLVRYLEQVLAPWNSLKLSMDIQVPPQLSGDFAVFETTIIETCSFFASRLINGLIDIEIAKTDEDDNTLNLQVDVRGTDPTYRAKPAPPVQGVDAIWQEAEELVRSLPLKTSFSADKEYLQFTFEADFDHNPVLYRKPVQPFRGKMLLLADDNELNAMICASFLEEWGCRVTKVINGIEAVDAIRRTPFDLVLMDIHMPELSGNSAIRQVREFNTNIPIIALTASALEGDISESLHAGANDILLKPISSTQLNFFLRKYI